MVALKQPYKGEHNVGRKQRKGIGTQGVAALWWEDIDIASVITASGPTPTHMWSTARSWDTL